MLLTSLLLSAIFAAQLELGNKVLEVEIADTSELRAKGLSGRKEVPDGTGMLFVYGSPQIGSMSMKNTLVPLSVGYFDENKALVQWFDMLPAGEPPYALYKSQRVVSYALEVPMGWFRRNKIQPDAQFKLLE